MILSCLLTPMVKMQVSKNYETSRLSKLGSLNTLISSDLPSTAILATLVQPVSIMVAFTVLSATLSGNPVSFKTPSSLAAKFTVSPKQE
ncbi:MAG: hypothetical protein EBT93_10440 [Alphaproteobacteria bacterium]|nr:hypothetical protein [Alphaproteobacteria bacterium]